MRPFSPSNACFLAVFVLFGLCDVNVSAQDAPDSPPPTSARLVFQQTIDRGILFSNGQFIEWPYAIEATESRVTVNGVTCFEVAPRPEVPVDASGQRRRWRSDGGQRGKSGGGDDTRTGGDDGRSGVGRNRMTHDVAECIAFGLEEHHIVVASHTGAVVVLNHPRDAARFCEVMLATDRSPEQFDKFVELLPDQSPVDKWRELLAAVHSDEKLRNRLVDSLERVRSAQAVEASRAAAVTRMETFAYPLTLVAMLVGVISLGHVMKWTARSIVAEQREDYAADITHCVEVALLLMLVMSGLDLVWTILAGQAGVMREVNPFAAGFIQSPLQLVLLKVCGTGLGFGILYSCRQRRQIQDATWWMCLVCVLLTFRWVVFDSVIG